MTLDEAVKMLREYARTGQDVLYSRGGSTRQAARRVLAELSEVPPASPEAGERLAEAELEALARVLPDNPRRGVEMLDKVTALVVQHQHDNRRVEVAFNEAREQRVRAEAAEARADALQRFVDSRGYRRCDIAACNCGSFHDGNAETRLREISELLADAGVPGGTTIYGGVLTLRERADALAASLREEQKLSERADVRAENAERERDALAAEIERRSGVIWELRAQVSTARDLQSGAEAERDTLAAELAALRAGQAT